MSMYQEGYNCVMNAYKAATGEALEPETALDPMIVTIDNYTRNLWFVKHVLFFCYRVAFYYRVTFY